MFWKSTLIISILYSEFGDILGEKTHNKRWDRRDLVGKDPRGWTGDRTQRDLPESDPDIQIFLWISKWLFLTVWSLGQEQTALYRVALQVAPLPHGGRPSYHHIKTGIYHSLRAWGRAWQMSKNADYLFQRCLCKGQHSGLEFPGTVYENNISYFSF